MLLLDYWKPVAGFESYYEVSIAGHVRRVGSHKLLKRMVNTHGYYKVNLWKEGKQCTKDVHVMVGRAFHGEAPDGHMLDHLNMWKLDCYASNLEYVTCRQNTKRYWNSSASSHRRTSDYVVEQIRSMYPTYRFYEIARLLGLQKKTVRMIALGFRR